tara:strand:- start:5456 stop:7594 length:2139 start_codon:yes stop_codon:yes gene_type:complete
MTVNTGVKGTLAKLLATEDLIIEHRQCETAAFDVQRRVLTLPVWDRASENVYDLLVSHEVGHALYTPTEWQKFKCPQSFVNVTEDARIEKLMKRRYQGLPKTFFKGYQELNDEDFFCVGDKIAEINLIDRINLHFKIGNYRNVPFTPEEQAFVRATEIAETFEQAVAVAEEVYAFMKQQQEEKEKQKIDIKPEQQEDGQVQGETVPTESSSDSENSVDESDDVDSKFDQDYEDVDLEDESNEGGNDPLEANTDKALTERLKDLINNEKYQHETEYVEIPVVNEDQLVVGWKKIVEQSELNFTTEEQPEWIVADIEKSAVDFKEFQKKSQKEVNFLVKEFECRKAADAYARTSSARTGVLDTGKLHTYKYNDDIFKRINVVPDGKNHGMIFILDWSGSMSNCLMDTVKQVLQLAWFCRKVNIPFKVLAFSYAWSAFNYIEGSMNDRFDRVAGNIAFGSGFSLLEMLSSECTTKEFNRQALCLWRNAGAVSSNTATWGRFYSFNTTPGLSLSGTPLIETIAALHSIIPGFVKRHALQKCSVTILTDGESSPASIFSQSDYLGGRVYENMFGRRAQLRDRKTGKIYRKMENPLEQVNIFLENLKDRFPQVSLLGFRLCAPRDVRNYLWNCHYMKYMTEDVNAVHSKFKKEKFYEIKNSPYDALYVLPANTQDTGDELDKLTEEATTSQIRTAFKKMNKGKSANKRMLNSFARTVA